VNILLQAELAGLDITDYGLRSDIFQVKYHVFN
jgi:hypothetical protein